MTRPIRKQISKAKYERALKFCNVHTRIEPSYNFRVIYQLRADEYPSILVYHTSTDRNDFHPWGYWMHPVTGATYRIKIQVGHYKSNFGKVFLSDPWNVDRMSRDWELVYKDWEVHGGNRRELLSWYLTDENIRTEYDYALNYRSDNPKLHVVSLLASGIYSRLIEERFGFDLRYRSSPTTSNLSNLVALKSDLDDPASMIVQLRNTIGDLVYQQCHKELLHIRNDPRTTLRIVNGGFEINNSIDVIKEVFLLLYREYAHREHEEGVLPNTISFIVVGSAAYIKDCNEAYKYFKTIVSTVDFLSTPRRMLAFYPARNFINQNNSDLLQDPKELIILLCASDAKVTITDNDPPLNCVLERERIVAHQSRKAEHNIEEIAVIKTDM